MCIDLFIVTFPPHLTNSNIFSVFLESGNIWLVTFLWCAFCCVFSMYTLSLEMCAFPFQELFYSVNLSRCNRIPWTGWLINDTDLFPTVLETGLSKVKVPAVLVTSKGPLPGSQTMSSYNILMWLWARELTWVSFIRALKGHFYKGYFIGRHPHHLIPS